MNFGMNFWRFCKFWREFLLKIHKAWLVFRLKIAFDKLGRPLRFQSSLRLPKTIFRSKYCALNFLTENSGFRLNFRFFSGVFCEFLAKFHRKFTAFRHCEHFQNGLRPSLRAFSKRTSSVIASETKSKRGNPKNALCAFACRANSKSPLPCGGGWGWVFCGENSTNPTPSRTEKCLCVAKFAPKFPQNSAPTIFGVR